MPTPQVRLQGLQVPQGPQVSLCRLTLGAWRKRHAQKCELALRAPSGSPEGPFLKSFPSLALGTWDSLSQSKNTRRPKQTQPAFSMRS